MPRCSICNAPNVNKQSCPLNPHAKNVKPELHNIDSEARNVIDIDEITSQMNALKVDNQNLKTKLDDYEDKNVQLWQKYMKECDEADLYYARWLEVKEQKQRKNSGLLVSKRVTEIIQENKTEYGECAICLASMTSDDYCVTVCGHDFHKSCLTRSLQEADKCPICRA